MCEPEASASLNQVAENATTERKSFLQGLKPVECEHSTSELKLRPPKEKTCPHRTHTQNYLLIKRAGVGLFTQA